MKQELQEASNWDGSNHSKASNIVTPEVMRDCGIAEERQRDIQAAESRNTYGSLRERITAMTTEMRAERDAVSGGNADSTYEWKEGEGEEAEVLFTTQHHTVRHPWDGQLQNVED